MGTGLVGAWVAARIALTGRPLGVELSYRLAAPLAIGSLLSLLLVPRSAQAVTSLLIGAGFACFDIGLLVIACGMVARTRVDPIVALGATRACNNGGMLVGALLGQAAWCGAIGTDAAVIIVVLALVTSVMLCTGRIDAVDVGVYEDRRAVVVSPDEAPFAWCDRLADGYGLTPREREVLGLLLEGRSNPYIEQELSLSKSTVKTHVRHIYEKLGVSDRQGLFEMVARLAG